MRPVSQSDLLRLAGELSPRRWELLRATDAVRLATDGQLRRLCYDATDPSTPRVCRRDLAALHEMGVLHRLQRRIGGVRAGSTGFSFAIGSVGRRLLELRSGEGVRAYSRYEPSLGFVEHALAVTEVWVGLHEYMRDHWIGERDVQLDFRVERRAWREYLDAHGVPRTLKPDAEVRLQRQEFDDTFWLEVDRATERRSTIRRKLDAYVAYYRTGREQRRRGVFPLTAWLTTTDERVRVLREVVDELPRGDRALFRVGLLSAASPFLLSSGRFEP